MFSNKRSVAAAFACFFVAVPALSQTTSDGSKADAHTAGKPQTTAQTPSSPVVDPSPGAHKQATQGLPPNLTPYDGANPAQSQGQASKSR